MKRLLLVAYCFPPILTAEALLVLRTVRALEPLGWTVTVLTVDERTAPGARDDSLLANVPASTVIVRAPTRERPFQFLHRLPLRTALWLGLPEEQLLWYRAAVDRGSVLLRAERFDGLLSWASFHASNVVALRLAQQTDAPWVAHFSDPWVASPYFPGRPLQRAFAARLERKILEGADAVTFTTKQTVDLVGRSYPGAWRDRAVVIPHGFEPAAHGGLRRPGALRMVHTGIFYKDRRTPLPLLDALASLHREHSLKGRLEVVFVGPFLARYAAAVESLALNGIVRFVGQRPYSEAQRIARDADVLLVIDAPSTGASVFLPSKLVEYLAFRRPILGLTPREGASADLLRRLELPVVEPTDVAGIQRAVAELIGSFEDGTLVVSSRFTEVAREYEISATTAQLVRLLERLPRAARRLRPS